MDDRNILDRIGELVAKEHELEQRHVGDELDEQEEARLRELEIALDQCWDLLRQRRSRRSAGLDPDEAEVRPAPTVEGYRQ